MTYIRRSPYLCESQTIYRRQCVYNMSEDQFLLCTRSLYLTSYLQWGPCSQNDRENCDNYSTVLLFYWHLRLRRTEKQVDLTMTILIYQLDLQPYEYDGSARPDTQFCRPTCLPLKTTENTSRHHNPCVNVYLNKQCRRVVKESIVRGYYAAHWTKTLHGE